MLRSSITPIPITPLAVSIMFFMTFQMNHFTASLSSQHRTSGFNQHHEDLPSAFITEHDYHNKNVEDSSSSFETQQNAMNMYHSNGPTFHNANNNNNNYYNNNAMMGDTVPEEPMAESPSSSSSSSSSSSNRPPILFKSTRELRSMNLSSEDIAEARRRAAEDCSTDYQSYLHPMLDHSNKSIMWTAHSIMKERRKRENEN